MKKFKTDYTKWVRLNGDRQNIRVVTNDKSNPVVLFVHGGPGVCDRHWVYNYQAERFVNAGYTIVMWDQRGSGKSYKYFRTKRADLCVNDYVEDCKALVEWLCKKFNKEKIVLIGHSWGTIIGTPFCKKYPEHIAAYVGQGQFVEGSENELISFNYCLEEAKKAGDKQIVKALEGHSPVGGVYDDHKAMMAERDALTKYGGAEWNNRGGLVDSLVKPFLKYDGYHLWNLPKYALGALYLTDVLWPEVVSGDYFKEVPELTMPVLMTIGRHDYNTPFEIAERWYNALKAPVKEWVWFEDSAHSPIKEEPEAWGEAVIDFLNRTV